MQRFPRRVFTRPATAEEAALFGLTAESARAEGLEVATVCRDIETGEYRSCERDQNHSGLTIAVQKC